MYKMNPDRSKNILRTNEVDNENAETEATNGRYYIRRDEDANWYLVPMSHIDAFNRWIECQYTPESFHMPDGIIPIEGIWNLTFTNPAHSF